jgi:hypothetical protein
MNRCRRCGGTAGNEGICETCKAWEGTVTELEQDKGRFVQAAREKAILAADLRIKRLEEAVDILCRETLGAIINATTMVQVEKLSGNIVKEEYAKGELHSLRLLESWLDRHVPGIMAELRRRAKEW